MYGRLWSAVSDVSGAKRSGVRPALYQPRRVVLISMERMRLRSPAAWATFAAAGTAVCVWACAGYDLMKQSLILKRPPRPPKADVLTSSGPDTSLKKPASPSKIGVGHEMPARASCAAKTLLRAASGPAKPFQFDNTPIRVWRIARWPVSARLTASVSWAAESFISLPAVNADEASA